MIQKFTLSSILLFLFIFSGNGQTNSINTSKIIESKNDVIIDYLSVDDVNTLILTTNKASKESVLQLRLETKMSSVNLDYPGPLKMKRSKNEEVHLITIDSAYRINWADAELSFAEAVSIYDFYTDLNRISVEKNIISNLKENGKTQILIYRSENESYDTTYIYQDYRCEHVKMISQGRTADLTGKPERSVQSSYPTPVGGVIMEVDSSGRPTLIDREPVYSRRMESTRQSQYSRSRKSSSSVQQPIFFSIGGVVVVIDGDRKNIARHSLNGELLSSSEIDYARPIIWSNGSDEFNRQDEDIFISTKNSKGFQYSRLNPATGIAELIFKSEKYWDVSRIKHFGDKVYFVQSRNGLEELHEVDLK